LKAIGVDDRTGVLRFSLSRETGAADVDAAVAALADAVRELGGGPATSPLAKRPARG
jgi:cysteine sulfinate desulfinase/cysteine desulfurase-like protein